MPSPVITTHVYPPIPLRRFDWAAYRDPEGAIYGEGPTEAAAISDLLAQEADMADDIMLPTYTADDYRTAVAREVADALAGVRASAYRHGPVIEPRSEADEEYRLQVML